nr:amylo-alpha-1,6-glucosidase [Actinoplanes auranticolor]
MTPRIGKPVKINVLWVNALAALGDLLEEAGRDSDELRARHARASFAARYRAPEGWLYDVVDGPTSAYPLGAGAFDDDPSLRPDQLPAWSLPHRRWPARPSATATGPPSARSAPRCSPRSDCAPLAPTEYRYQGAHRGGRDERGDGGDPARPRRAARGVRRGCAHRPRPGRPAGVPGHRRRCRRPAGWPRSSSTA